jgi:hypothetical protein
MTTETLGTYGERSSECEYLTLAFSPLSTPLRSRWRNNGLSADFLGDYVTTFLPTEGNSAVDESRQKELRHAVAYIANELLENAMKYHESLADIPIRLNLALKSNQIALSASNGVSIAQARRYRVFVERFLEGDAGELLLRQQEEGASREAAMSCLGLLTMVTDYGVQLGWRFEAIPEQSEMMTVTTSAVLPLKEVAEVSA